MTAVGDGVGERLTTINDAFLNTAGFKAAGWHPNPSHVKRTHSPPIPTAIASEYFQAHPSAAGRSSQGQDDDGEEGGMVTGGGAGDTLGPGAATKRRRRREQLEEDSSDLSDESDEEGDQRAAQQIKFAKMPIRNRSGSSPIRGSSLRQTSTISSPSKGAAGQRRGSQPALNSAKGRARRETVTSSEMSSDNEIDASVGSHRHKKGTQLHNAESLADGMIKRQHSDLLEEEQEDDDDEEEEDSDASDMTFEGSVDSEPMIEGVKVGPSPITHIVGTIPRDLARSASKVSKPAPAVLQPLPAARPISTIQPRSLLSAAIRAKRTKAAMPFESFASLSGQGDPNPLKLRIWVPFATSTKKPFEVLLRRSVHENEANDRQVTVADLIGLSLWRYFEEKIQPALAAEKLNVNRWTLRLIEDEEVDYDFPALERTKPVVSFATANNRAVRSRSNSKPYDEFALVEATEDQFQQNQTLTPQFKQEAANTVVDEDPTPRGSPLPLAPVLESSAMANTHVRQNPLLAGMARPRTALADTPAAAGNPLQQSTRPKTKKLLRIHIQSADATPGQMITLDVTTDTYLADVLDTVCKRRQLDKANHVLKLAGSGTVVLVDRTVESIGNCMDLDLFRRRFATDGPLTMSGSPSSSSGTQERTDQRRARRQHVAPMTSQHPLAQEASDPDRAGGGARSRRYTVWRKQPMRFVGMNERVLTLDGEYLHILPAPSGKTMFEGQTKNMTFHFSNIVGCKVSHRHPTNFKVSHA